MGIRDQTKLSGAPPPHKQADAFDHSIPRVRHRSPTESPERRKRHRGAYAGSPSSGGSSGRVPRVARTPPRMPARAPPSFVPVQAPRPAAMMSKSRRLYVGNIPFHVGLTDVALTQFFSALYVAGFRAPGVGEPLPVVSVWLHSDGKFGFMELRGEQEAVNMMQLNGVFLHARPLRINRPSDYRPEMHVAAALVPETVNAHAVVDLCGQLGGLAGAPMALVAAAAATPPPPPPAPVVRQDMSPVRGDVGRGRNGATHGGMYGGMHGGAPVAVQATRPVTAPAQFNGSTPVTKPDAPPPRVYSFRSAPSPLDLEKQKRALLAKEAERLASVRSPPPPPAPSPPSPQTVPPQPPSEPPTADDNVNATVEEGGKVISLVNLVTNEDLEGSDEDYEDLVDDVKGECSQYGNVRAVEIPRTGLWKGTAFVEFSRAADAGAAVAALRTRVFDGRIISSEIMQGCASAEAAAGRGPEAKSSLGSADK